MDDRCETEWRTSSYTGEQGQCVEVRVSRNVCMRDTKARSAGMLQVSAEAWASLLGHLEKVRGRRSSPVSTTIDGPPGR